MIKFFAVLLLVMVSGQALADHRHRSPSYNYHYHHGYHNYHNRHYGHNRRHNDNDDWAWAVGGLVLGSIIANSNQRQQSPVYTLPPPQRRVQTCYDEVAYDHNNTPYVARRCVETIE